MKYVAAILVIAQSTPAFAQEVQAIPPGDDKIVSLQLGQPAPFAGQLFEPNTALRWANWLKQYQLVLKLNREHDAKVCKAHTDFLQDGLSQERARYKVVSEDYQKRAAAAYDENNRLRTQLANPPWYSTVWFGIGLGVLTTSIAVGMGVYAAK